MIELDKLTEEEKYLLECKGYMNAYKHCLQMCEFHGFMSMSNGMIIRVSDAEHFLKDLINYYENELKKGNEL